MDAPSVTRIAPAFLGEWALDFHYLQSEFPMSEEIHVYSKPISVID